MFDGADDHVGDIGTCFIDFDFVSSAEESEVDAFRSAGGEDEFGGVAIEERCEGTAGIFDGFLGYAAHPVSAVGVGEVFGEEREHGFPHASGDGGGGAVIEVDGTHGLIRIEPDVPAYEEASARLTVG